MTDTNKDQNWKPADVGLATAYLTVTKVEDALDFYQRAFGFEVGESLAGSDGALMHASMKYQGTHIFMMGPENGPSSNSKAPVTMGDTTPVSIYLYNPDVDAMFKRAAAAGAKEIEPPHDEFWGDRMGTVKDPFGYEWVLATKVGEFDASKVPKFD